MNCLECLEEIERLLDGADAPAEYEAHLATCRRCHDADLAARALLQGVAQLAPPAPPAWLGAEILESVLRDRIQRRRQRWLVGTAAAAAAIVAAFAITNIPRQGIDPAAASVAQAKTSGTSVQDNVQEAGQALADLTRRTATDTLDSSRALLPAVDFTNPADTLAAIPDMPAEPRRAWNDAIGGLTAGLEPLAASAMQAASFFRREVPLLGQEPGPGM